MYFLQPSQKRLLNSLNPVFVVVVLLGLVLMKTTSQGFLPSRLISWDILLPLVVYFGQRRPIIEGLILTLFTSHLYSLCSSAPIGVFTTNYLVIFLVARLMSYVVYANNSPSILALIFLLSLLSRFVLPAVAGFFGHGWAIFSTNNLFSWGVPLNAVMGFLVYILLVGMDRLTFKAPRANIELSEDGL